MKKTTIIIFILFYLLGCGSYSKISTRFMFSKTYLELEKKEGMYIYSRDITRKEYRNISKILNKKYGKGIITGGEYFASKKKYYCEFQKKEFTTYYCLILDKNLKITSEQKIEFDH